MFTNKDSPPGISNKISLLDKTKTSVTYRCDCSCLDPEHRLTIDLECDKEFKMLFLRFYKNLCTFDRDNSWYRKLTIEKIIYFIPDLIQRYWNRFKKCTKLLITGYIELEEEFILNGYEQLDDFIDALIKGKEYLNINDKPPQECSKE